MFIVEQLNHVQTTTRTFPITCAKTPHQRPMFPEENHCTAETRNGPSCLGCEASSLASCLGWFHEEEKRLFVVMGEVVVFLLHHLHHGLLFLLWFVMICFVCFNVLMLKSPAMSMLTVSMMSMLLLPLMGLLLLLVHVFSAKCDTVDSVIFN